MSHPGRYIRDRDDPPGCRSPSVRGVQSGMSQSGNQRAMSSSHGSSAPSWALMRSSRSVSRACSPWRGHERVVGAALEVVDEVERLAVLLEGEHGGQQAVAVAAALQLARDGVDRDHEVVEVRVLRIEPAVAELVLVRLDRCCRCPRRCRRSSSSVSSTICWKSAVPSGWKTIPARPRCFRPSPVSSVTFAVVIANSRSGAGAFSLRLPPEERVEEAHQRLILGGRAVPCSGARAPGGARSASPSAGGSRRATGSSS